MTTDSVNKFPLMSELAPPSADEVVSPRQSPDSLVSNAEVLTIRTRAMAATLIKERFQKLPANLTADERDSKRATLREESVRQIFKMVGILPIKDIAVHETFSQKYQEVEATMPDIDKSRLTDLLDTYENHPTMAIFDTLSETSGIAKDDLVFMRRASLVLLEEYLPQRPQ